MDILITTKNEKTKEGDNMCIDKIKRWLALRKARKLEEEKLPAKKDIIGEDKKFFKETQKLKKLITKGKKINIKKRKAGKR